MKSAMQSAIEELEHEVEAIDQRRGDLVRAIDTLRPLAGDTGQRKKSIDRRTNERTNEARRGPSRSAEPP